MVIKKLFRPARKVTKLRLESVLGATPSLAEVYVYVHDEVLALAENERVPLQTMGEFMGAINKRNEKTRSSILADESTPYSYEERQQMADTAIEFCEHLNKGYASYRNCLLYTSDAADE